MKKKKIVRLSLHRKTHNVFTHPHIFPIALLLLGVAVIGKYFVIPSRFNFLDTQTALAKGSDASGGDSGGGNTSDSSLSGNSNSGSSGSSNGFDSGSSGGSGSSGSSGSGSSGGGSLTGNSVSENTTVLCTGPDGKQFDTKLSDCQELNNAWHKPVIFTTLPNQPLDHTIKVDDQVEISSVPPASNAPEIPHGVAPEKPHGAPNGTASDVQHTSGITKIQLQGNTTKIEQIIFENGVNKKVEMRNDNGRIRIRIQSHDQTAGTNTDQQVELQPEDGTTRLNIDANGVEQSVTVKAQDNQFVIEQEGNTVTGIGTESATTHLPITIDPATNSIAVTSHLGTVTVNHLPTAAIQQVLSNNTLDTVTSTELGESDKTTTDVNQQIVYKIAGVKDTKFLGIFKVDAPILAEVSAVTGEQTFVTQPWYLNAFGFLFTK